MRYEFIQASWVVEDLEASIRRWQAVTSVGPFFINPYVQLGRPLWRGTPTAFQASLAIAQAGPMQVEFFQQHDDLPSPYRDVFPRGREGFHHLACFVEDMEAEIAYHAGAGTKIAFDAFIDDVRVVYVDTRASMGFMIELLEHKPSIVALFAEIADASIAWDGTDPIRPISDLTGRMVG